MLNEVNKLCGRTSAYTFVYWIQDQENTLCDDTDRLFTFLDSLHVPACVSPLHSKDINSKDVETGETFFKKWHYHVVIDFGSGANKSANQILELLHPIREFISVANIDNLTDVSSKNAQNIIKLWKSENQVKNMRSLLRYFKHLDNPEKHQYLDQDFFVFGGFDVENRIYSQEDRKQILKDILRFISQEECFLYCDLVDYCLDNGNSEWFNVITNHMTACSIVDYMKSCLYRSSGKWEKVLKDTD